MGKYILVHGIRVAKDFTPETFGRLTTLGPAFLLPIGRKGRRRTVQVCQCGCSKDSILLVGTNDFRTGNTLSCGCLQREQTSKAKKTHGRSKDKEYRIWASMVGRCRNPKDPRYSRYGGRGISVCDEWVSPDGFVVFISHIGPRPSSSHSLDRIDNEKGYVPGNVRWASASEQQNNKGSNRKITYDGKTQNMSQWAREKGMSCQTLSSRLRNGWTIDRAINTPIRRTGCPQPLP